MSSKKKKSHDIDAVFQIEEISFNSSPAHHAFFWFLGSVAPLMTNPQTSIKLFKICFLLHGIWQEMWIVPYLRVEHNAHLRRLCISEIPFVFWN